MNPSEPTRSPTSLEGRRILVTGGAQGLGEAISARIVDLGGQVLIADVLVDAGRATAERLGDGVEFVELDVSSADGWRDAVTVADDTFGGLDGLVNNAAIGPLGTVLDTDAALFARIQAVNVTGVFLMSRAVIPQMRLQGGGSIVNIGSGAGWGKPNMAAYAASKGAIFALSTAMAYDHFQDHIRVNVAIPGGGGIVSGMSVGRADGDEAAVRKRKVAGTVAGRALTGTDFAQTVAFLLSNESQTISGTVIDVGCFAHQGGPVPIKP